MKTFPFLIFLTFSLGIGQHLNAQKFTFQEGYIIPNNNDTIWGEVEDDRLSSSVIVVFRNSNGGVFSIPIEELRGFRCGNDTYARMKNKKKHEFVKICATGKIFLYESIRTEYSADHRSYTITTWFMRFEGETELIKIKKYDFKASVRSIFSDTPKLLELFNQGKYTHKDFPDFIKRCNEYYQEQSQGTTE